MKFYEKYILKGFFGWENTKWFIREIRNTFSNQASYFARKRIESFILFINAMILLDAWYIASFDKIDYVMALAVFTAQMVYAGYQVSQIRKDMKLTGDIKSDIQNIVKEETKEEAKTENGK
jgi:hypothetical protein